MNANFTRKPTPEEARNVRLVSDKARELVSAYASEVSDAAQWPNAGNVDNTRAHLLAYISWLEQRI